MTPDIDDLEIVAEEPEEELEEEEEPEEDEVGGDNVHYGDEDDIEGITKRKRGRRRDDDNDNDENDDDDDEDDDDEVTFPVIKIRTPKPPRPKQEFFGSPLELEPDDDWEIIM